MKATAYVLVALALLVAAPVFAQGPFTDVPTDHWAYDAVNQLQKDGILIGYPDGTFGGKRTITRYEFAVAIARVMGMPQPGTPGQTGLVTQSQLNEAISKLQGQIPNTSNLATKADLEAIRKLVNEFQDTLAALGVDVDALKRDVAALTARVCALEIEQARVKWTGDVNVFAIAGATNGGIIAASDIDNRTLNQTSLSRAIGVVKDFDLNVVGRVNNSTTANASIDYGNYLNYLAFVDDYVDGARPTSKGFGGFSPDSLSDSFFPYYLYIDTALGKGGLTVGRFPLQFTPYTLKKIDVDHYTNILQTDDGNYPVDGAKLAYNFGVVDMTLFAVKNDSNDYLVNGLTGQPTGGLYQTLNVVGGVQHSFHDLAGHSVGGLTTPITQTAGARFVAGIPWSGTLGATYYQSWSAPAFDAGLNYDQARVFGADITIPFGFVGFSGSWTRSDSLATRGHAVGDITDANIAADGKFTAGFGKLSAGLGYKYIRRNFAAAGYWDQIGRWTNPTNVKGPYGELAYPVMDNLKVLLSGEWLTMINDATNTFGGSGLRFGEKGDVVAKAEGAIKFGFTKNDSLDASYQWVKFNPSGIAGQTRLEATESYLTVGIAHQMSANSKLQVGYQFINYDDGSSKTGPYLNDYRGGEGVVQFGVGF